MSTKTMVLSQVVTQIGIAQCVGIADTKKQGIIKFFKKKAKISQNTQNIS